MVSKTLACTAVLFLGILSSSAITGPIINGGFETGDWTGWEPPDWGTEPGQNTLACLEVVPERGGMAPFQRAAPHSGIYSRLLHHDCRAWVWHDFYQDIDISDGWNVLTFWLNVDLNPNAYYYYLNNHGNWAGVDIREHGHGDVITNLVTMGGCPPGPGYNYGTNGWKSYTFQLTDCYTGGREKLTLSFWLWSKNGAHRAYRRIYVDDVELVRGPVATVNMKPNTFNLKSEGKWLTCYLEFSEGYSVEDVDVASVSLYKIDDDPLCPRIHPSGPSAIGDYNGNGIPDLMVKYNRDWLPAFGAEMVSVKLTVRGELMNGLVFEGSDTIRVIDKGGENK